MKVAIDKIKTNPKNPRIIKDDKFKKLVQSLKDFPEMADVREVVVNKDMVVLGGNMRLKAMKEAGWKEVPVKVVDWTQEKQDQFIIKDNASFGDWDWDVLANEWDAHELDDWGIDLPGDFSGEDISIPDNSPEGMQSIVVVAYDDIQDLDKITEFYNLESIDMPTDVKEELARQRKVYVFKK